MMIMFCFMRNWLRKRNGKEGVDLMKILIVTGGRISLPFASAFIKQQGFDRIIAADSGLAACQELGLPPTDILGDFDSLKNRDLLTCYREMGIPIREFPSRKDYTDTELAVLYARDLWMEEKEEDNPDDPDPESRVWILGATGTRLDHTLSNLGALVTMTELGIPCTILDDHNEIELLKGPTEKKYLPRSPRDYISLLSLAGTARGIDLIGFSYPMKDGELPPYVSLGISNEITEKEATLRLKEGCLLVIRAQD